MAYPPEPETRAPGDADVARLLHDAGRRPEVSAADLAAIRAAFRAEWERTTGGSRRAPRRGVPHGRGFAWALAAALLATAAAGIWWVTRAPIAPAPTVARVEVVDAVATWSRATGSRGRSNPATELQEGAELPAGVWIETVAAAPGGRPGRVGLRLASGVSLRLDGGSRVRLQSADRFELERGAIYVDSAADGGSVEVLTAFGSVRDIGTQFEVRLRAPPDTLRVRVRTGAVALSLPGGELPVEAGEQIEVGNAGATTRASVSPHGTEWSWILGLAPPFALEQRTPRDLLEWVARETGLEVRYADEETAAIADRAAFRGAATIASPTEAAFRWLPVAGLQAKLADGALVVSRTGPAPR